MEKNPAYGRLTSLPLKIIGLTRQLDRCFIERGAAPKACLIDVSFDSMIGVSESVCTVEINQYNQLYSLSDHPRPEIK